jgi:2-dehydro-3-deoxyphosphogluconate aldolase / (4S)-4-hydroxy-2-oxoglutarate aldolase
MSLDLLAAIRRLRVVPVATALTSVAMGLRVAEALRAGGLPVLEVTFRTAAASEIISEVAKAFPDFLVGAGTVLTRADLHRAQEAGARFAVAPGCNPTILQAALADGFPFLPGVATPSDVERALELGVKALKFFPAEALGGVKLLKAIEAPYAHLGVQFVPTGGISTGNMGPYLQMPSVLAVGGSWMLEKSWLVAGQWEKITEVTQAAVALANGPA